MNAGREPARCFPRTREREHLAAIQELRLIISTDYSDAIPVAGSYSRCTLMGVEKRRSHITGASPQIRAHAQISGRSNANALDLAVWYKLRELFMDDDFGDMLEAEIKQRAITTAADFTAKVAPLERELGEVRTRINRLIAVIEDGKADGAIRERLRQLEDRHRDIQAEIKALEEERIAAAGGMKGIEFFSLLRELIKNSEDTPQPAIIRALVGQLRLGAETLEMDLTLDRFVLRGMLAPRAGFEPATRWLIPPPAGLYQLCMVSQVSLDSALFDLLFPCHGFTACFEFLRPHHLPWTAKTFRSLAPSVVRVIVLPQSSCQVICRAAIAPPC